MTNYNLQLNTGLFKYKDKLTYLYSNNYKEYKLNDIYSYHSDGKYYFKITDNIKLDTPISVYYYDDKIYQTPFGYIELERVIDSANPVDGEYILTSIDEDTYIIIPDTTTNSLNLYIKFEEENSINEYYDVNLNINPLKIDITNDTFNSGYIMLSDTNGKLEFKLKYITDKYDISVNTPNENGYLYNLYHYPITIDESLTVLNRVVLGDILFKKITNIPVVNNTKLFFKSQEINITTDLTSMTNEDVIKYVQILDKNLQPTTVNYLVTATNTGSDFKFIIYFENENIDDYLIFRYNNTISVDMILNISSI